MFSGYRSDFVYPHHSVLITYPHFTLCVDRGLCLSWLYALTMSSIFMKGKIYLFWPLYQTVKFIQSTQFINKDLRMYHNETNTPALARTSNLNEELGQVCCNHILFNLNEKRNITDKEESSRPRTLYTRSKKPRKKNGWLVCSHIYNFPYHHN